MHFYATVNNDTRSRNRHDFLINFIYIDRALADCKLKAVKGSVHKLRWQVLWLSAPRCNFFIGIHFYRTREMKNFKLPTPPPTSISRPFSPFIHWLGPSLFHPYFYRPPSATSIPLYEVYERSQSDNWKWKSGNLKLEQKINKIQYENPDEKKFNEKSWSIKKLSHFKWEINFVHNN